MMVGTFVKDCTSRMNMNINYADVVVTVAQRNQLSP